MSAKSVLTASILLAAFFLTQSTRAATWYVDASIPQSGDGTTWETAFSVIQDGVDASSDGDTVIVGEGVYVGVSLRGKNITLVSTNPHDPAGVARTVIDGGGKRLPVLFKGTEDETCTLSGFTVRGGYGGYDPGAGISGSGTRATIRNNVIKGNRDWQWGAGLAHCDGLIENNIIRNNYAGDLIFTAGKGGGLYACNGIIRNNTIVRNEAMGVVVGGGNFVPGEGGAMYGCRGVIQNCIFWENCGLPITECSDPISSLVHVNPRFVHEIGEDFRLTRTSPCIDAGLNDPDLSQTDIAGMPRIMYGGKSFTVDIGAYEFFYTGVQNGPAPDQATLVWSFVPDKTYSIFYSSDLLTWHLAIPSFPSSGNTTTSWTDDGSLTRLPPSLVPLRFYRLLENP